ncbi:hypothetical protein CI109_105383 [Kwoniella shandongensis]|uniref:Uncharacterized protein n=1 Tax=Kwoniella shandongensis TaxID=1734106 RepID=A0A5M6BWF8_9TREE|nr:uncharacterized protein CI109_006318 [Kwoniella shandongensis]KAA5525339.1 hypothetical protein CI109_006318 [Kwoniella shandongensis]
MNKRPLPTGLPIRPPYMGGVGTPGPAPPLPAGPAPTGGQAYGQPGQGQVDPAAHAAAWAAYYQSQGVSGAAYSAPAQPAAVAGPAAPGPNNPYANYGYGAGAQHANATTSYQAQAASGPSQGYRPPPAINQAYATTATQPSLGGYTPQPQAQAYGGQPQYGAQQQAGYQTPQPQAAVGPQQQQQRPPYQPPQGQQGGYGWGATQPGGVGQQGYRPPQGQAQPGYNAQPPQQPFYPQQPQQQQQPYTPPTQNFRPPQTPQPIYQNQSYRPPNQARPPRPPMVINTPPHPSGAGFPPAKRPRFDGPGGMGGGVGVAQTQPQLGMNHNSPVRPPSGPASMGGARPPPTGPAFGGVNMGQPGFGVNRSVSGASSVGVGRGGAPVAVPVSRPPIHLGRDGPPLGLGLARGAGAPLRGGLGAARGGRGGLVNAPRGPAGMRRGGAMTGGTDRSSLPPARRGDIAKLEKEKERDKKKKDKEAKSTMMDFRIVGIEVKELGWSWGLIGGHKVDVEVKEEEEEPKEQEAGTEKVDEDKEVEAVEDRQTEPAEVKENGDSSVQPPKTDDREGQKTGHSAGDTVKVEAEADAATEIEGETEVVETAVENDESAAEVVEEKRGEKRKAKTPDADEDNEGSSKKRTSTFFVTHRKPNHLDVNNAQSTSSPISKFESSHNRFRIYFDSPPELDRIPKAARKAFANGGAAAGASAGNKRGRRDTSSVAPSRVEEGESVIGETVEEQGEEAAQEEVVQEAAEASVQPEEVATEAEHEIQEDTQAAQITEGGEAPVIESSSTAIADESASAEVLQTDSATVEDNLATVEGADQIAEVEAIVTEDQPSEVEPVSIPEAAEEIGDISMMTDPGAAIEQLMDEASVVVDLPAGDDVPVDIAAEDLATQQAAEPETTIAEAIAPQGVTVEGDGAVNGNQEPAEVAVSDTAEVGITEEHDAAAAAAAAALSGKEASAAEVAAALVKSAENTASAYKTRARRHSSVSTTAAGIEDTAPTTTTSAAVPAGPSTNRLSILYEESSRRLCFDAEAVEKVRIWRKEGRIEVELKSLGEKQEEEVKEGEDKVDINLPKGILIETYDNTDQRFVSLTRDRLVELYPEPASAPASEEANGHATDDIKVESNEKPVGPVPSSSKSNSVNSNNVPPFHRIFPTLNSSSSSPTTITVYTNKKNPLSEPKWCRTNQADVWLYEQFGSRKGLGEGWKGKLEIMDPDPGPTLKSILENWASNCNIGSLSSRRTFVSSLLSSPNDLLEILLRLTRGDRNPTVGSTLASGSGGAISSATSQTFGALATSIRPNSPYASHQTHVSLAILAMYRLTTDYATRAGEKKEVVEEKIGDIIKSLPTGMIGRSLDGLFKEWQAGEAGGGK